VIADTAQLEEKPILVSIELGVLDTAMRKTSSYDRKNSSLEKRASEVVSEESRTVNNTPTKECSNWLFWLAAEGPS